MSMQLGAFSISLAVKDLEASRQFYEQLGFTAKGGDPAHHYLIMSNGPHVIGLFQGMFDQNILTFNPGWDQHANPLESFTDVREIQDQLKKNGLTLTAEVEAGKDSGPAHITLIDPDGNPVLIDQHV